jgi:hypothetical protein
VVAEVLERLLLEQAFLEVQLVELEVQAGQVEVSDSKAMPVRHPSSIPVPSNKRLEEGLASSQEEPDAMAVLLQQELPELAMVVVVQDHHLLFLQQLKRVALVLRDLW